MFWAWLGGLDRISKYWQAINISWFDHITRAPNSRHDLHRRVLMGIAGHMFRFTNMLIFPFTTTVFYSRVLHLTFLCFHCFDPVWFWTQFDGFVVYNFQYFHCFHWRCTTVAPYNCCRKGDSSSTTYWLRVISHFEYAVSGGAHRVHSYKIREKVSTQHHTVYIEHAVCSRFAAAMTK